MNDPNLIAEASRHYWVEYGPAFTALDPAFPQARPGDTFAAAVERFAEVPDVLRHKVTLRLKAELRGQLTSLFSYGGAFPIEPKTVLDHTFTAVELVGKPVSIGHFVNTWNHSAVVFNLTRYTYSPYLLIGQNDTDLSDDPIIRGTDYFEQVTNFPMGSQNLTGLKLEMDVIAPGGASETHERWLLDKVGYDVRVNGGQVEVVGNEKRGSLSEQDFATIYVSGSITSPAVIARHNQLAETIIAQQGRLLPMIEGLDFSQLTPDQVDTAAQADVLARQSMMVSTWARAYSFSLKAEWLLGLNAETLHLASYFSKPRIVVVDGAVMEYRNSDQNPITSRIKIGVDLLSMPTRDILYPGQSTSVVSSFNVIKGISDSFAEHQSIDEMREGLQTGDVSDVVNVGHIFQAAHQVGIGFLAYSKENAGMINSKTYSDEAKERMAHAVERGMIVLAPSAPVLLDGKYQTAWYEIDQERGVTLSILENGHHGIWSEFSLIARAAFISSYNGLGLAAVAVLFSASAAAMTTSTGPDWQRRFKRNQVMYIQLILMAVDGYQFFWQQK